MQFLVEEALLVKLELAEAREEREAMEAAAVLAAEQRVADLLKRKRGMQA